MKKKKKKKGKGGGARWVISIREEVRLYEPLPLASIENLIRFFFFFLSPAGATARWHMNASAIDFFCLFQSLK